MPDTSQVSDEYGVTTITAAQRCKRIPFERLVAEGWQDMNRSGCHGEWRRTVQNTETVHIQEVYNSPGWIRRIYWRSH